MNILLKEVRLIERWSPKMGGVFSVSDLKSLFNQDNLAILKRRVDRLAAEGVLARFCRGIYTTPKYDADTLASRVSPHSYVSLGTVLARELMIGSIPAHTLSSVKIGRTRTFEGPSLTLVYLGLAEHLFFGFRRERGIQAATPEKALLDTLYFHQRGHAFSFDIFSDIDVSRVDRRLLESYLEKYRNPRFVRFVEGYLDERA
ncbi:MAG: hypothetical protein HY901_08590 [Deltaproteobacteria bacterium]|nr:hypothetical protein [Deltaproteobacteria bacterium]